MFDEEVSEEALQRQLMAEQFIKVVVNNKIKHRKQIPTATFEKHK